MGKSLHDERINDEEEVRCIGCGAVYRHSIKINRVISPDLALKKRLEKNEVIVNVASD